MVRVAWGCVLEEVLDEEDISRDALDWLDEKVVETKLPFTVPRKLLGKKKEEINRHRGQGKRHRSGEEA